MKNQKGITLIALVITIIVLLILAGVSIAMLTGENGLLTQANNSKAETVKAEAIERINLALNAVKAEIYEEQVTDKNFKPAATATTLAQPIIDSLTLDGFSVIAEPKDGDYWYTITDSKLTLHYKNSTANVAEVTGAIDLSAAPYSIDRAPISAE